MTASTRSISLSAAIAPAICLLTLGAALVERASRDTAADVEPYHKRVAAAVSSVPYTIGYWTGADDAIPPAAQQLLRPNALLSRTYVYSDPRSLTYDRAGLVIIQCRDPRDMQGHYPPICYVAHGQTLDSAAPRTWTLAAEGEPLTLDGRVYEFSAHAGGQSLRVFVYNILLVPGVGAVEDMSSIYEAASSYQRRLHGAAQIQVTVSADLPPHRRDEVAADLIAGIEPALRAILADHAPASSPPVAQVARSGRAIDLGDRRASSTDRSVDQPALRSAQRPVGNQSPQAIGPIEQRARRGNEPGHSGGSL